MRTHLICGLLKDKSEPTSTDYPDRKGIYWGHSRGGKKPVGILRSVCLSPHTPQGRKASPFCANFTLYVYISIVRRYEYKFAIGVVQLVSGDLGFSVEPQDFNLCDPNNFDFERKYYSEYCHAGICNM
jgi:hypothetical protein